MDECMKYYITNDKYDRIGEIELYDSGVEEEVEKPSEIILDPNKLKVALVIGHDMEEKGAYGSEGISEFDFNNTLLSDLVNILPQNNEYGMYYRQSDIDGYTNKMEDLHKRIDEWGADISIEFHFNSFNDHNVNGNEVLYCSDAGKKVAMQLDDAFDRHLINRDRGIKKVTKNDRGGGFCCRGKSIAIIAEPFFGAHQKDYCRGGEYREELKASILEFLAKLTV